MSGGSMNYMYQAALGKFAAQQSPQGSRTYQVKLKEPKT